MEQIFWRTGKIGFQPSNALSGYVQYSKPIPETGLGSSLVSLIIGLIYLAGTIGSWHNLKPFKNRIF